jgi:hypothetical protein
MVIPNRRPPHTHNDDQEAQLVVYRLGYQATAWVTTGDALLARSAADAARARREAARDALTDEAPRTPRPYPPPPDTFVSTVP